MPGPDKTMVIRHAEKPIDGGPSGVNLDGSVNERTLIVRGWQRAGGLVQFFANPTRREIAKPGQLFACGASTDPTLPPDEAGFVDNAPAKWPGERFDMVWILDRRPDGTYAFTQVDQLLLSGDVVV